jgi:hypothetical protein
MATQGVCAGESATTAPVRTTLESAATHELLLARVQTFVTLAVVLASECFAAHRANERSLIRVCSEVRAQVVCSSESFRAESTLEGSRVFLLPAAFRTIGWRSLRIGKVENVVSLIRSITRAATIAR